MSSRKDKSRDLLGLSRVVVLLDSFGSALFGEVFVGDLVPSAVVFQRLDGVVDPLGESGVALCDRERIFVVKDRLVEDLDVAVSRRDDGHSGHLVEDDRVDGAVGESLHGFGCSAVGSNDARLAEDEASFAVACPFGIELGEQMADGAALSADDFAFEIHSVGDGSLVAADDDHLRAVKDAVREVDGLVAGFAVRNACHGDVGLTQRDCGKYGVELHVSDLDFYAEQLAERSGDVHIPALEFAADLVFERRERRIGGDDQDAGFFDLLGSSAGRGAACKAGGYAECDEDRRNDNDTFLFIVVLLKKNMTTL